MSKILVDTIDTRSGTTNITIGSSNASQITLKSGATLTNFPANTPAFSARMSASQTISNETYTKVDFDTEIFDTDNAYDHSTNQRFTVPSGQAGKYFFYTNLICSAAAAAQLQNCQITFYKNGSEFKKNTWNFNSNDIYYAGMQLSSVIDLSESDYIEVYSRISDASGSPEMDGSGSTLSEFTGYKLI
jgi:hypothetical protein